MNQMVALLRDPSMQILLRIDLFGEMPSGAGILFRFRHGTSFTSWGEIITIYLTPVDNSSVRVDISSECSAPTQIIDWGKNRENIDMILNYISGNLARFANVSAEPAAAPASEPGAASGVKYCSSCGTKLDAASAFCSNCGAKQS